jgi:hypothetical protein
LSDKPHSPDLVTVGEESCGERRQAPSAARNTGPILEVLRGLLPARGRALEIASGTGQHAVAFAEAFPGVVWQPSDQDQTARDSIAARVAEAGLDNLRAPLAIDVMAAGWSKAIDAGLDLIVCINMVHISPWEACEGLAEGTGALLRDGGLLYLYGPYKRDGRHTAPSNEAFDGSLRARNSGWGIRDMADVARVAGLHGMILEDTVPMPANNFSLVFRKAGA